MDNDIRQFIFQREDRGVAGERRFATVLFVDLVQSTDILKALDTEDSRRLLDHLISQVREAVHSFEGSIARVQGDGVMALFGVPVAQEQHAERAAMAALDICARFSKQTFGDHSLRVRVGIHSGEILVRWQDSDFGSILDVVGATAHVAGKLQQVAPDNGVALSANTAALLDDRFTLAELDASNVSSLDDYLPVFELLQHDPVEARSDQDVPHGLLELVGHAAAVSQLTKHFQNRLLLGVSAIGFTGAAGIGKTRVLQEAERLALEAGYATSRIIGHSFERANPFGAIRQLVQERVSLLGVSEAGDISTELAIAGLDVDDVKAVQFFQNALADDDPWHRMSPDARNNRLVQSSAKLILRTVSENGEVLLVDDFHYTDSETRKVLFELHRIGRDEDLIIVVASRPESKERVDELCEVNLSLSPLSEAESLHFVRQSWARFNKQGQDLPNNLGQMIQQRAQGMPLALQFFCQHSFDQLARGEDVVFSLPHQLDTIFRAQIDNLDDEARTLFQIGCVLGYEFALAHLKSLVGLSDSDFVPVLERLFSSGLVRSTGSGRLRFSHQLLQEAGYFGILKEERQQLHKRAYDLLSLPDCEPAVPQVLALHAEKAGRFETAIDHLMQAMRDAISQGSILSIDALYQQACGVCTQLGDGGQKPKVMFTIYAFDAMQQLGKQEWYRDELQLAVDLFEREGDQARLALATGHLAITDWTGGRNIESLQLARRAHELARGLNSEPLEIYTEFTLGNIEYLCSYPSEGLARLKALAERLNGVKQTATFGDMISVPGIMVRAFTSWYLVDMDEPELAREYADQAAELAQIVDQHYSHVLAGSAQAYVYYREGKFSRSSALLYDVVDLCIRQSIYGLETIACGRLTCSLVREGKLEEAQAALDRHRVDGHMAPVQNSCAYYLMEGEARLLAARDSLPQALAVMRKAIARSVNEGDQIHILLGRYMIVELAEASGQRSPDMCAELETIAANAEDLGLMPLARDCRRLHKKVSRN